MWKDLEALCFMREAFQHLVLPVWHGVLSVWRVELCLYKLAPSNACVRRGSEPSPLQQADAVHTEQTRPTDNSSACFGASLNCRWSGQQLLVAMLRHSRVGVNRFFPPMVHSLINSKTMSRKHDMHFVQVLFQTFFFLTTCWGLRLGTHLLI